MPCPARRESILHRTLASVFLVWPKGRGVRVRIRRVVHVCLLGILQCSSDVVCKTRTQNHFLLSLFSPQKMWISLKPEVKGHYNERHFSSDFSIASFWGCGNLFPFFQELVLHCQDCSVENKYIHSFIYIYSIIKESMTIELCGMVFMFWRKLLFFSCSSIILHLKCKCSFPAHGRGVTTRSSSRSLPVHTILWSVSVLCWQFWNALLFDIDFTSSFILLSCMKNLVSQIG